MATGNFVKNVQSNYATPLIEVDTRSILTNTTPVSAYRGAGRPEGNYFMERLIEQAARETGRDPVELRRLQPHQARPVPLRDRVRPASTTAATSRRCSTQALARGGLGRLRRAQGGERGARHAAGRGIGNFLECTAPPSEGAGRDPLRGGRHGDDRHRHARLRPGPLDAASRRCCTRKLGVPFDAIRLVQGDSDQLVAGGGTGGSKSLMASGAAIVEAAELVVEKGRARRRAGARSRARRHRVRARRGRAGRFVIAGTDRGIGIMELAERVRTAANRPPDVPDSLDVRARLRPGADGLPERLPRLRGGGRPGHRACARSCATSRSTTSARIVNPAAGRRARRMAASRRASARRCWSSVAYSEDGQLLSAAPTWTTACRAPATCRTIGFLSQPPRLRDQPARRQGLRRGGLRGLAAGGDERAGRCARRARRHAHRHAGNARARLARAARCAGRGGNLMDDDKARL